MKLFIIALSSLETTLKLLTDSCHQKNISYEILDPATTNPLAVGISPGDAVYRASDAKHYGCLELEHQLMGPGVQTFYKDNNPLLLNLEEIDSFLLHKVNIPVPKTANYIPQDRDALRAAVEKLGGFPLIIKALGGSHGVGVMRVDSYESLFSVSDFLITTGDRFVMKEYLNVRSSARIIVLNNRVIDSIEYRANDNDFRSNEGSTPNVFPATFNTETQDIALKAVAALGLEFGGVDLLITDKGAFVTEVNFPCYFARCQMLTNTDISGMMIDFLAQKSQQYLQNHTQ